MHELPVQQVRSFNRTVAERIGALDDRFLRRSRPMTESRLLWEIEPDGAEVAALRRRLNLEGSSVSRVLRSLQQQGLVKISASPGERKMRRASLTTAGLGERAELDRRSDALAVGILDVLTDRQQSELISAMEQVERLLHASMVTFAVEDPSTADARWCFEQYFGELDARFDAGFDPQLSISADASELTPPEGLLLMARLRGRPVGCGAIKFHGESPAELKRMWISPSVRGMGVGRRMLSELERRARKTGVAILRLETNRALSEAIALYRRAGYVEVEPFSGEPYAHHWFEKKLSSANRYSPARRLC
jgi:DNA-binding MarR family transcriptional regulator/GNAT superfamily N-acetyltransferase